jgi:hypothetical protein
VALVFGRWLIPSSSGLSVWLIIALRNNNGDCSLGEEITRLVRICSIFCLFLFVRTAKFNNYPSQSVLSSSKKGLLLVPALCLSPALTVANWLRFVRRMSAVRSRNQISICVREAPAANFCWVTGCPVWDVSFLHPHSGAVPQFSHHSFLRLSLRRYVACTTETAFKLTAHKKWQACNADGMWEFLAAVTLKMETAGSSETSVHTRRNTSSHHRRK